MFIMHDYEENSLTKNPKLISINYFRTITDQGLVEYIAMFGFLENIPALKILKI